MPYITEYRLWPNIFCPLVGWGGPPWAIIVEFKGEQIRRIKLKDETWSFQTGGEWDQIRCRYSENMRLKIGPLDKVDLWCLTKRPLTVSHLNPDWGWDLHRFKSSSFAILVYKKWMNEFNIAWWQTLRSWLTYCRWKHMRQDEVWKTGYGYENVVKKITYTYQKSKLWV